MATCEVCGNDYYLAFEVIAAGQRHVFDSFECAIHKLAPICDHCGCKIIGHGIEAETEIGPLINARQAGKVEGYIKTGSDEGAKLVAGGSRLTGALYDGGNFIDRLFMVVDKINHFAMDG